MAAIGKIRQRSGLLIIIVGVALAAFVLGDLFKNMGKGKMKYDPTVIAYINGEKIPSDYFRAEVEQGIENMMRNQNKKELTPAERYQVQMQIWEKIKSETVLRQQAVELGLAQNNGNDPLPTISMEEYADLLTGSNPHPFILQNFKDENGKFDPTRVTGYLSQVEAAKNSDNPKDQEQGYKSEKEWLALEQYIKTDQLSNKYYNLISKAYTLPNTIARAKYADKNNSVRVRYVGIRYNLVNDTMVNPTDNDYQAYYEEHKNEFKNKKETRKVDYIVWNVRPSADDISDIEKNVKEMYSEMLSLPLDETPGYVNRNSDEPYDSTWKKQGELSPFIDSLAFNSEAGTAFAPWSENNAYHFGRLMAVAMRPDSMRASHILIAYAGAARADQNVTRTKIGAAALADSLLEVVKKSPAKFEELATTFSDGPSKTKAGDLDWFADGAMVPQFNEACVHGKVGDMVKVETPFGFHIIKITGKKDPVKKVRVALVNVPVMFSQKTYELAFNQASNFVSKATNAESFDTLAANLGLNVMHSSELDEMSEGLRGIPESRKIVQWLFEDDREPGEVSDVFDFNDKVVVVLYKHLSPKGIRPLDDEMKDFIKVLVVRDLKAKILMDRYSGTSDLNTIAQKAMAKIDTMDFLTFSAFSLQGGYGPEPNVIGRMVVGEDGKSYGPVKGDQGIYFFAVDDKSIAPEPKDGYGFIAQQEENYFVQSLRKDYNNATAELRALIDKADIQDYRRYFY